MTASGAASRISYNRPSSMRARSSTAWPWTSPSGCRTRTTRTRVTPAIRASIRTVEEQAMNTLIYLSALAAAVTSLSTPARASSDVDRCDAILQQDLFNRVSNSTKSSSSERAAYEEQLFKMSDTQAYEEYEKKYASSKAQATSGATEFHYGVIGGELEFSHSYDRKLSVEDFSKTFKAAKESYDHKVSSSNARDASLISLYQSSVRDPASVKAWENCMTGSRAGPGLIAYG